MAPKRLELVRPRRGRPRKFGRPSRAVTLTLPDDVIAALARIDADLGRAVVEVTQPLMSDMNHRLPRPSAGLSKYGRSAVIVTRPLPGLQRIPGVTLVPLPDGRALISLAESMTAYEFEVRLRDAIEAGKGLERRELSSIAGILKAARQTNGIALYHRSIIVLQSRRQQRIG